MGDLTNFDVYKITKNPTEGYIFAVSENSETEEVINYRYYIITINKDGKPTIKRLNNMIEILNSELFTLEHIDLTLESEELKLFITTLSNSIIPRQKQDVTTSFFKDLEDSDLKLFKRTT